MGLRSSIDSSADGQADSPLSLSDGEIEFLWWFIQGSIMDPDVRQRLRAHWGLCARHSTAFFAVEAAFRPHLIHGCTILFGALIREAAALLAPRALHRLMPNALVRHRLADTGPCHVCALGYGPASPGHLSSDRVAQGRDLSHARRFALDNRAGWQPFVCGRCIDAGTPVLCRAHLFDALSTESGTARAAQYPYLRAIAAHLSRFDDSFRWNKNGTDTAEDRGALIAAIGWCAGWNGLLDGLGVAPTEAAANVSS